jgi:hypothetical protein
MTMNSFQSIPTMPAAPLPHPIDTLSIAEEMVNAMRAECRRLVEADDFLKNLPAIENAARAMRQLVITLQPVAALAHHPHIHHQGLSGMPSDCYRSTANGSRTRSATGWTGSPTRASRAASPRGY